ncbi:MAG: hypothetical protein R3B06_23735 [Kofleriaceae bacterium]
MSIVLLVLAALLLVGTVSSSWFTPSRGSGGVGLTGVEACRGGECRSVSWGDMPKAPKDLAALGWFGLLGGLSAVGVTVAAGVMGLTGKAQRIPFKPFSIVYGLAACSMTMFFMRVLTEFTRGLSIGFAGILAIGALIAISVLVKLVSTPTAAPAPAWPATPAR